MPDTVLRSSTSSPVTSPAAGSARSATAPFGKRQFFEMTGGRVHGPRLTGRLVGTGGDRMLTGPDGFLRMDVRLQIETHDGATILAHYFGPAEANQRLMDAVKEVAPTGFADAAIRSHWLLEAGDPRYAWVNQTAFIGRGRMLPTGSGGLGFEHQVYRMA